MAKKLQKSSDYSDFFNNLIEICNLRNTTPTALAEKYASKSVLTAWKNGTINTNIVSNLALELNVSLDYLLTGEEKSPSLLEDEQELLNYYKALPAWEQQRLIGRAAALAEVYEERPPEPKVPVISLYCSDNRVSAGLGDELYDYEQWDTIDVIETSQSRKADFMLIVDGDSMSPKFSDGDYVLIRQQPAVDIGQIGIFNVDGKGYIKKYEGDHLVSLNPKYEDISLKDKDFRCFGLVLGVANLA